MLDILQPIMGVTLFLVLFGLGLGLTGDDFKHVLAKPKPMLVTLICQLILLPSVALLIASAMNLPEILGFGLLLLAVCPGGVSSNMFSRLTGGDTAMSVSLTGLNSILAIATIPAILYLGQTILYGEAAQLEVPIMFLIMQLFGLTLIPLSIGMSIRHFFPKAAEKYEKPVIISISIGFFLLIFSIWYLQYDTMREAFSQAWIPAILLFVTMCAIAIFVASSFRLKRSEQTTLVYEVGIQNSPVAVFIALNVIENIDLIMPSMVYSVVMTLSALAVIPIYKKYNQGTLS